MCWMHYYQATDNKIIVTIICLHIWCFSPWLAVNNQLKRFTNFQTFYTQKNYGTLLQILFWKGERLLTENVKGFGLSLFHFKFSTYTIKGFIVRNDKLKIKRIIIRARHFIMRVQRHPFVSRILSKQEVLS